MSDSLFQVAGVSSGIAWDEIINKMLEAGKKPATQWQKKIDTLEVKKTLYQELQGKFNTLRNKLTKLRLSGAYNSKKAQYTSYSANNVSPENIVTAKINNAAELGWWDVEVKSLARAQRHMSARASSVSEAMGLSGDFRIRVGKQYATITVDSADSLREINYKISKAVDQNGNAMAVTSKIIDNRIVVESAVAGTGSSGDTRGVDFTMTGASEYFLPHASVRDAATGNYTYPQQIFHLYREDPNPDGTMYKYEYIEGADFDYDSSTGKITWQAGGQAPPVGTVFNAVYSEWLEIRRGNYAGMTSFDLLEINNIPIGITDAGNYDYLPALPTGQSYLDRHDGNFTIISNGVEYVQGDDFKIVTASYNGVNYDLIEWQNGLSGYTGSAQAPPANNVAVSIRIGADTGYTYDENVFYLEPTSTAGYSASGVLAGLGFITPAPSGFPADLWTFTDGSYTNASNAEFELDGVPITRTSNTIDDLIANVSLELRGLGQVRVNIVRDLEDTTKALQDFTDAYNDVMEWINVYVAQKQDGANPVDETDYLSSILSKGQGKTVYGVLHGDQLLWSIKNQLRARMSNPIATLSSSLTSRKVSNTADAMNIKSSFYIYTGGKASRIDIVPTDSLEAIQRKLSDAQNRSSQNGSTAAGGSLGLNVSIRNGQLVIEGNQSSSSSVAAGEKDTITDTIIRNAGSQYDYLSFIPVTSTPINGSLTVYSGQTVYQENIDYRLSTNVTKDSRGEDVISSRIEWLGANAPASSYNVSYSYSASAISFSEITNAGPMTSDVARGMLDLSFLGLHQDSSKLSLSNLGFTTESTGSDYVNTGFIEFNADTFVAMMESDPDIAGNAMLAFMRDFDVYIGNLVDSSQVVTGGQIVTKGRIANALNNIDTEQASLQERITNLEKQLETKQTALYKQYSDMEVAIQKLNAQMSSLSNFISKMGNSSS